MPKNNDACPSVERLTEWTAGLNPDQAIERHLDQCQSCRQLVTEIHNDERALSQTLNYRLPQTDAPCPSDDELARFIDRTTTEDTRMNIFVHLAECARCQRRLTEMADELAAVLDPQSADVAPPKQAEIRSFESKPPAPQREIANDSSATDAADNADPHGESQARGH